MRRRPAPGFTYIGLIILVAIIALVGAAGMKMGSLFQRAAAEEELLEIGAQFSAALRSYAAATPPGQKQQPPSLQELLKDPRFPNPRRHLRKIFVDPVTGKAEWGVVYLADKVGVIAVYSLSDQKPLKIANFDIRFQNMENRERISDWKFVTAGGAGVDPAVVTPPNSMTGAPSLFVPGFPGNPAAGGAGKAGAPAAGGPKDVADGSLVAPPQNVNPIAPPAEAPPEVPPEDDAEDDTRPDEEAAPVQPLEPPPPDDKEGESGPEPDSAKGAKPPEPSPIVAPPPPPPGRRQR